MTHEQIEDFRAYLLSLAKAQGGTGEKENAICDLALGGSELFVVYEALVMRRLSHNQMDLVLWLYENPGVHKAEVIYRGLYGQDMRPTQRGTIAQALRYLRKKLKGTRLRVGRKSGPGGGTFLEVLK